jgi:hypothetical protein
MDTVITRGQSMSSAPRVRSTSGLLPTSSFLPALFTLAGASHFSFRRFSTWLDLSRCDGGVVVPHWPLARQNRWRVVELGVIGGQG